MIGQNDLKEELSVLIENNKLPKFIILQGKKGSGKKLLCKWLSEVSNNQFYYVLPDVKVETIRQMIDDAYTVKESTLMVIPDADSMSLSSKNAILKVVEEPPKNITFVMTLQDINNTLETIKSRASVFSMNVYRPDEIGLYCSEKGITENIGLYKDFCETPGQVDLFNSCGPKEMYEYTQLVIDNIGEVQSANAFKSSSKLSLKADSEGYDLALFWKIFIKLCMDKYMETRISRYIIGVEITSKKLKELNRISINKQHLYDSWVFDIREKWY